MSRPRYIVTLEPVDQQIPGIIRLRKALKCLLRSFGLRCTSVSEHAPINGENPPRNDSAARKGIGTTSDTSEHPKRAKSPAIASNAILAKTCKTKG